MSTPSGTLHSLDSRNDLASSDRPAGQGMHIKRTRPKQGVSPLAVGCRTYYDGEIFVFRRHNGECFVAASSPSHVAVVVQRLSLADARDKAVETAITLPTQASRSVQEAVVEVVRGTGRLASGDPCHRRTPVMCELQTSRWKVYRRMCC